MAGRRKMRTRLATLGVVALAAAIPAGSALASKTAGAAKASPSYNGLALTPPMGFNDWNAFACNVSEALIKKTALAMHTDGMQAAGYDYVNIDDCWMKGRNAAGTAKVAAGRDAKGHLIPDPTYFPDGITALADYVHSLGLKLGIYEDIGTATCQGLAGSYGHVAEDARDFAKWGVDYIKYDDCNLPAAIPSTPAGYKKAYTQISKALQATGRPIVYSICEHTETGESWLWGPNVSNLWRTTTDIRANFASMVTNFTKNAVLAQYAGPGHWNDPDMLEIGTGTMTNLASAASTGDTTVKVDSVNSAIPGSTITVGTKDGNDLESDKVASVGTAATNTTLFSNASAGDTNVKVAGINGFSTGDPITVDGDHTATITSVGTAGANSTLFTAASAGAANIKVASVNGAVVGKPITIDTGSATESPTVTSIGTAATSTTLAAASAVGDSNIKVTNVTNIDPGDTLAIDTGTNAETVTATSVGTAGATGTGITVTPALTKAHSAGFRGAAVADQSKPGTGITFSPALTQSHAAGTTTSAAGSGITFTPGLSTDHASGGKVIGQTGTGITLAHPLHRSHLINAGVGISGMTVPEERSEMSLWAMESAPMIAGTDIVNMAGQSRKIYENTGVIAVDQDALGTQAAVLSNVNGQWILEKPLQNGDKAVALFNAGSTAWKRVSVSMASLGLSSTKNYRATDLWSGDQSVFKNNLTVRSIAPHATVILRIKA